MLAVAVADQLAAVGGHNFNHQLGNPDVSGRDLVTIHIYAPPLGVLKTYKLGSATIEQYTPAEPDFV
jgi:hypothetical protein